MNLSWSECYGLRDGIPPSPQFMPPTVIGHSDHWCVLCSFRVWGERRIRGTFAEITMIARWCSSGAANWYCHLGPFPTCAGSTASVAYLKTCSVFTWETKSEMWVQPHFQGASTIHSWENLSSEEDHSPRTLVYPWLPIFGPIKRLVPGQASWWGSRTSSCLPCITGKASWERQVTCLRSQSWWTA